MNNPLRLLFAVVLFLSSCDVSFHSPESMYTPTPEFGWFIYFQYELGEKYWEPGNYQYQITSECTGVQSSKNVQGQEVYFTIDENAPLIKDTVIELALKLPLIPIDGFSPMYSINPKQKTKFVFGYKNLSYQQALEASDKCKVHTIVNGNLRFELLPSTPTQKQGIWPYYSD